jgi:hypothetical protein
VIAAAAAAAAVILHLGLGLVKGVTYFSTDSEITEPDRPGAVDQNV